MQPVLRRQPYFRQRFTAPVLQSEVLCVEGSRPQLPPAAGLLIGHCMENGLISGFSWLCWIPLFFSAKPHPLGAYQRPESLLLWTLRKILSPLLSQPRAGHQQCCLQSLYGPGKWVHVSTGLLCVRMWAADGSCCALCLSVCWKITRGNNKVTGSYSLEWR